jgi:hypothetical protein
MKLGVCKRDRASRRPGLGRRTLQQHSLEQCHWLHHAKGHARWTTAGDSGRPEWEVGSREGTAEESPPTCRVTDEVYYLRVADHPSEPRLYTANQPVAAINGYLGSTFRIRPPSGSMRYADSLGPATTLRAPFTVGTSMRGVGLPWSSTRATVNWAASAAAA